MARLSVGLELLLVYPEGLRSIPESRARPGLEECDDLEFALVERRADSAADLERLATVIGAQQRGSVGTLAECLLDYWIRTAKGGAVDDVAQLAS